MHIAAFGIPNFFLLFWIERCPENVLCLVAVGVRRGWSEKGRKTAGIAMHLGKQVLKQKYLGI